MRKLLKIPTSVRNRVSLEEHRDPATDPDIIQLDPPVEQPVVVDGDGSTAPAGQPENAIPPADGISPDAPAATEPDPELPAVEPELPVEPTEPPAEPAADPVVEPGAEVPPVEPAALETPEAEPAIPDVPPAPAAPEVPEAPGELPVEPAPEAPVEPVEQPAEPIQGEAPVDPTDVPPMDAGTEPAADPAVDPAVEPAADPAVDPALPPDVVTADPIEGTDGTAEPAAPAEAAADPVAPAAPEAAPTEGTEVTNEMTSAWVDGVSVDAEEVKQHLEAAADEVLDADNVTEELQDAVVALEQLHEIISEDLAVENPVVSETTVNLVKVEAEKALEKIGEVLDIPSIESPQTPEQNLRITMEAIGEKIKEIWDAIVKALAKAWDAVVNFFKGVFDSAERLKNSIAKLQQEVKGLRAGEEPTEKTLTTTAVIAGVVSENSKTPAELVGSMAKLDSAIGPFLTNSKEAIHKAIVAAGNKFLEVVKSDSETVGKQNASAEILGSLMIGYSSLGTRLANSVADGANTIGEGRFFSTGVKHTTSGQLPGTYIIEAADFGNDTGIFTDDHVANLRDGRFIGAFRAGSDVVTDSFDVASEAEMSKLLEHLASIVDAVIASKGSVSQFESDIASFRRQANTAINGAQQFEVGGANLPMLIRAISNVGPSLVRINSTLIGMVITISSNVVKYVAASGKQYPTFGTEVAGKASKVENASTNTELVPA